MRLESGYHGLLMTQWTNEDELEAFLAAHATGFILKHSTLHLAQSGFNLQSFDIVPEVHKISLALHQDFLVMQMSLGMGMIPPTGGTDFHFAPATPQGRQERPISLVNVGKEEMNAKPVKFLVVGAAVVVRHQPR